MIHMGVPAVRPAQRGRPATCTPGWPTDPGRPDFGGRAGRRGNSRLPSERDLAESYGVAVGTVRQALDELRRRGLVATLPAKGTFVTGGA